MSWVNKKDGYIIGNKLSDLIKWVKGKLLDWLIYNGGLICREK